MRASWSRGAAPAALRDGASPGPCLAASSLGNLTRESGVFIVSLERGRLRITVYVPGCGGRPLTPADRNGRVRRLLKDGGAKAARMRPFTIQLQYEIGGGAHTQPLFGVTGPGRANIGNAALKPGGGAVYASRARTRNKDVPDRVKERRVRRHAFRQGERKRRRRAKKNGQRRLTPLSVADPVVRD